MMMVGKKLIIIGLGVILTLGTIGFNWVESILPTAEAHGVQAQLQSRFVRIEDETFNRQSLQTGEVITLEGKLVSLVERDMRAWLSIFSESTNAGNRWEILARDPPGNVFDIPGNGVVPYSISAKALEPGVYHVHTQLNVQNVGPGLGPGQTVVVDGEYIIKPIPYTNIAYQSIIIGVGYVITFATRPWQVI
jgi:methane/ammonia monooxygenase subunit B